MMLNLTLWNKKKKTAEKDGSPEKVQVLPARQADDAGVAVNGPEAVSTLNLAFLGDCVYDLFVREDLLRRFAHLPAREIHRMATEIVCAKAQAQAAEKIFDRLTQEEKTVFLRARNAHPGHLPKNAAPADYHAATALEAVAGYLFLRGEQDRLRELMSSAGVFAQEKA